MKNLISILNGYLKRAKLINHNILIRSDTIIRDGSSVDNSYFGQLSGCNTNCTIHNTWIGNYVNIASNVRTGARDHIYSNFTTHDFIYVNNEHIFDDGVFEIDGHRYNVKIGHDVWIGERSFISNKVEIGNGAVVAAGSYVTKSIPPYAIVGGVPAKFIKWRFPKEIVDTLEKTKWYELPPDEVLKIRYNLEKIVDFDMEEYKRKYLTPKDKINV